MLDLTNLTKMTQAQAVKETLRKLGGIATLKEIYKHVPEITDCQWHTKTPEASVRRIVQQDKGIIRLKAGYYILAEFRDQIVAEQTGDMVSTRELLNILKNIPSTDLRFRLFAELSLLLHWKANPAESNFINELFDSDASSALAMHFHAPVGQAIAHVDSLNTNKTN